MFWDKVAFAYDFFETIYNGKVYNGTGCQVAGFIDESDVVLECACGTGAISQYIAPVCKKLIATDFSISMLKKARKKCRKHGNVTFRRADITHIRCRDERFDKAVAGNVIHLLPDPELALNELKRVVKPGGKIIIPTYINKESATASMAARLLEHLGAHFERQFNLETYKQFFADMEYKDVKITVVNGRMPCAIAIIEKKKRRFTTESST